MEPTPYQRQEKLHTLTKVRQATESNQKHLLSRIFCKIRIAPPGCQTIKLILVTLEQSTKGPLSNLLKATDPLFVRLSKWFHATLLKRSLQETSIADVYLID